MSTVKSRPALCDVVRELRQAVGESQMRFAQRMGWHIVTVAQYETKRPPKGAILVQLERVAQGCGRLDLAIDFRKALADELSLPEVITFGLPPNIPRDDRDAVIRAVERLIDIMVMPQHTELRRKIVPLLHSAALESEQDWLATWYSLYPKEKKPDDRKHSKTQTAVGKDRLAGAARRRPRRKR